MMNFEINPNSIEDDIILFRSRSMSDPNLSDIDLENEWLGPGLPIQIAV